MNIKIKVGKALNFSESFDKLCSIQFPNFKDRYALAKCRRTIAGEKEIFEKARLDAIKTYGDLDEKGVYTIDQSGQRGRDFVTCINSLLDSEFELFLDHKIVVPFSAPGAEQLTAIDIDKLDDIAEFVDDKA